MKAALPLALALTFTLMLSACNNISLPLEEPVARKAPSAPIDSPDVSKAEWSRAKEDPTLFYGTKNRPPLVTIECLRYGKLRRIRISRHTHADEGAEAIMALIAGKHMVRVPIKADSVEDVSLWRTSYMADSPEMSIFMGSKDINLTIPGAGLVVLKASDAPANLLRGCLGIKALAPVKPAATAPALSPSKPTPAADQG